MAHSFKDQELEKTRLLLEQLRHENYLLLEQLKSKDNMFKLLLARLDVIFASVSPDKTIEYLVGKGLESFNININDILGRSIYDAISTFPELIRFVENSMDGRPIEETIRIGDNDLFQINSHPIIDEDGVLRHVFIIALPA
ncbi:MAG: hypothetical protein AAF502_05825 [Bacteroidota bacterium]